MQKTAFKIKRFLAGGAVDPDFRTTGLSGICVFKMVRKDAWKWEENEEHLRTGCGMRGRGQPWVARLMQLMGLQGITPGPHTSKPTPGHKIYPYLLRNVDVERANQVWSTDITYISMRHGYMYLTDVIDWYCRYVLAWELSNSTESLFCVEAGHLQYGSGFTVHLQRFYRCSARPGHHHQHECDL